MILSAMNQSFLHIASRLKYPSEKFFREPFYEKSTFHLLILDKEDIFFTNPALFFWLDTGLQSITNASTNEKNIKLVHYRIFDIPKKDFVDTDKQHNELCCLINLNFNPNLSSKQQYQQHLDTLQDYKVKAKNFFTGENSSSNTSQ